MLVALTASSLWSFAVPGSEMKDSSSQLLVDRKSPMSVLVSLFGGVSRFGCVSMLEISPHMAESLGNASAVSTVVGLTGRSRAVCCVGAVTAAGRVQGGRSVRPSCLCTLSSPMQYLVTPPVVILYKNCLSLDDRHSTHVMASVSLSTCACFPGCVTCGYVSMMCLASASSGAVHA